MSALLVATVVLSGVYLLFKLCSDYLHGYWERRGVPQLDPEPVYGDLKGLLKNYETRQDVFLDIYTKFKRKNAKYGGVYLMYKPVFVPIDPSIVKLILTSDFEHFTAHSKELQHENILSANLFNLQGEPWRQLRRKLTPVFTSGKMKMMFQVVVEKADGLEAAVDREVGKDGVDIKDILARFTTDIIGSCAFGIECNTLIDPNAEIRKYGEVLFTPITDTKSLFRVVAEALADESSSVPPGAKIVEDFFTKMVKDTIEYREKNNVFKKDFMHLMIQLKNRGYLSDDGKLLKTEEGMGADSLTEFEVIAQCLFFFLAGFETAATTTAYALYELTQRPETQLKIREEVDRVLRNHGGKLTYDAVADMKYTEKVIREALRLHPPVAVLPRMCTKNYTIPGTHVEIEKGTMIEISVLGLQTDPDFFPDPDKFIPERFDDQNKSNIVDYTYLPFGEGPRICLGMRFGMLQSKVGIATLLRRYNFSLNPKTRTPLAYPRGTFISAVEGGLWVDIANASRGLHINFIRPIAVFIISRFRATDQSKMSALLVATVVLSGVYLLFKLYSDYLHGYWERRGVPQLHPESVYGDLKAILKNYESRQDVFLDIYTKFKRKNAKYGGVYLMYKPVFVPIDPSIVKLILTSDFEHFTAHSEELQHLDILNANLFNMQGEHWRQLRKKLTPVFTSGKMKMMFEVIAEKAEGMEAVVDREVGKDGVDIKDVLARFTTDIIGCCAFGIEYNTLNDPSAEIRKHGEVPFTPITDTKSLLRVVWEALAGGSSNVPPSSKTVEDFFRKMVKDTIEYREKHDVFKKDFMHLMIQLKNRGCLSDDKKLLKTEEGMGADSLTELEVIGHCLFLFLAGFETAATTMTYVLYELTHSPETQLKIREDVDRVLRNHGGKLTYEAVTDMKYTESVIREALRLHPPVAVLPRMCTKNYTIPGTHVEIEKGTIIEISVLGLQTDPDFFPDPDKFIPERFDDQNKSNIVDYTYLPFGEGPRICLGMRFGMLQSKVGIATLLRRYNFSLNPKTRTPLAYPRGTFISAVEGGLWVDIANAS
ncbi:uncharacterized protein LOC132705147 [Cylas formicarius]|uniref:uncharacterized protein LOC132705147 n=1 Tax=Cylas formicarius TaxID=197179 RepID=UPI0029584E20|nr:uncharacterized protein LOC132705147 [Cylas formicarius]